MQFVLASGNQHKAQEIEQMLPEGLSLIRQSELGVDEAEETGTTFIENALIKAKHAALHTGRAAIADDSGICVASLNGAPGVYSARYAGPGASDAANVKKLLAELDGKRERSAFFYCVLVCVDGPHDPTPIIAEGQWHGEVTLTPAGKGGFGYDPVFYLPDFSSTAAELDAGEKNQISHRGIALRQMIEALRERYPT